MCIRLFIALALLAAAVPAAARDERLLFGIEAALSSADGKDRFDDTIQFAWGEQAHVAPERRFGIYSASHKTNALTKTDQQACEWAFLSALASLRDQARQAGANAVVNIKSLYQNREFVSDIQYECRAGYFVTSVALEGRVVKLPSAAAKSLPEADASAIETTPAPAD